MSLTANVKQNPETRATAVAGLLVGAVVLVLGFGSGIGAVFSRHTASSSAASPSSAKPAAVSDGSAAGAGASDSPAPYMLLAQPAAASTRRSVTAAPAPAAGRS